MSKVRCEYCDSVFEYTGQANCPSCGASLGNNKQVEEINRAEAERASHEAQLAAQVEDKARQMIQNNFETQGRMGRFVTAFAIFVFIIILIGFLVTFISGFNFFRGFGGVFS